MWLVTAWLPTELSARLASGIETQSFFMFQQDIRYLERDTNGGQYGKALLAHVLWNCLGQLASDRKLKEQYNQDWRMASFDRSHELQARKSRRASRCG